MHTKLHGNPSKVTEMFRSGKVLNRLADQKPDQQPDTAMTKTGKSVSGKSLFTTNTSPKKKKP